jgi:hypothetical protein
VTAVEAGFIVIIIFYFQFIVQTNKLQASACSLIMRALSKRNQCHAAMALFHCPFTIDDDGSSGYVTSGRPPHRPIAPF